MEERNLDQDFAVVTGASQGIGLAIAQRLHRAGARVALLDRPGSEVQKTAATLGSTAIEVDIRESAAVKNAIEQAHEKLGGLSILVNNAGMGMLQSFHRYSDEQWDDILAVNLSGTFYAMRAAIPFMLAGGGGSIVNNASLSATDPTRGELPYSAAKAGVVALTKGAALEYGPSIRVNAVSPGVIRSPMTAPLFENPDMLMPVENATPLRRTGEVEDVADVVHFLCSAAARYVTGQNLVVDGGMGLPQAGIDSILEGFLDRMAKARKPGAE